MTRTQTVLHLFAILLGALIFHFLASDAAHFDPAIEGFGKKWQGVREASYDGSIVRGTIEQIAESIRSNPNKRAVLLAGASQLHTVSNFSDGDEIAVVHANNAANSASSDALILQVSYGNANAHELFLTTLRLMELGAAPDVVIFAMTYDDFREPGIRPTMYVKPDTETERICSPYLKYILSYEPKQTKVAKSHNSVESADTSPQLKLESRLLERVEAAWPAYAARGKLRGKLELAAKEKITRVLLGTKRRSSVRVSAKNTDENIDTILGWAKLLQEKNIEFRIYRAALLDTGEESYYVTEEYHAAWESLKQDLSGFGVETRDFTDTVPAKYFGKTNSGLDDYFHFDATGHKILGKAIGDWIIEDQE